MLLNFLNVVPVSYGLRNNQSGQVVLNILEDLPLFDTEVSKGKQAEC